MKQSDKIKNEMAEKLKEVPRIFLQGLIAKKIEEAGFSENERLTHALVEHAMSKPNEEFSWVDENASESLYGDLAIIITDEDLAALKEAVVKFTEVELPKIITNAVYESAGRIFKNLKEAWAEQSAYESALFFDFKTNLEARWSEAFDLLRMILTSSREAGAAAHKRFNKSRSRKNITMRSVLLQMHARACRVMSEIITLMENGYADGAMARWRTLYEISVVAQFIADAGEDMAIRYVDHEAVESKAALDEYMRCYEALGYKEFSKRAQQRIQTSYDEALKCYGKDFGSMYGWAAQHLKKRPSFRDLEFAVQRSSMRSHYKMASYNVHAGTKGMLFHLGLMGDGRGTLAGASNAGFEEPGSNAAFTFLHITSLLFEDTSSIEIMLEMRALVLMRDAAVRAFARANNKLQRDETRYTKKRASKKSKLSLAP